MHGSARVSPIAAIILIVASVIGGPLATPAAAAVCETSGPGAYTVEVCFTSPTSGSTLVSDETVTVTAIVTGPSTGIGKVRFYLGSEYVLTDYESPYSFTMPTDTFVDGNYTLEAEAAMRDGFVSSRATIPVTLANGVTTPPPAPTGFTPSTGTTPAPGEPFVVSATGDGASGETNADNVASLIENTINPNLFLYLGDVYEEGTYTEFMNWYGQGVRFGAFASITNPTIGNHERSNNAWPGYDFYWGTPDPWFSYDTNGWHFINLNLSKSSEGSNSAQLAWLANDLATNNLECQVAFFHLPVLSVGPQGDNPEFNQIWQMFVDAGVDIVLTGHEHSYQRWSALDRNLNADPDGTTQFVLGGGGHGIQGFTRTDSRLAVGFDTTPAALGALKLELNAAGASYSYLNTSTTVLDSGTIGCGSPDTVAPSVPTNIAAVAVSQSQIDVSWSASTDNVGVDAYSIYRDGALAGTVSGATLTFADTGLQPSTTYAYTVEAVDAAGNASGQSSPPVSETTASPPNAITFNPVADSYVDGGTASSNFGSSAIMRVDGSPIRRSYLRFDVAGVSGAVTSATLRVYSNSSHSAGYEVQQVTDNSWGELSITYSNAPPFGPVLGASGPTTGGSYTDIDVSSYIGGNGTYSFALTALNNTNMSLASRETVNPPELIVAQDTSGNNPPTAGDVTMSTDEDVQGAWTPSVSDPDPDTLTCSIVNQPADGTAAVTSDCSGGTYTPNANYNGPDSFVYEVSDGSLTDTGAVTVTVNAVNDLPTADPQSVTVPQDTTTTVNLTGSDVDGDCPLTFAVSTPPTNGSVSAITNQQCTAGAGTADVDYSPTPGFVGSDSFEVTVTDPSSGVSTPATISITVNPPQTDFTFNPVADSYVASNSPDNNRGTSSQLRVDGSPDLRSYLRFDVAGVSGAVTSATLRVYSNSSHSAGYEVQQVTDNSWGELSITYSNAPSFGPVLGASGPTTGGSYTDIDVTGHIGGNGTYSFALTPLNNTNMRLASRETSTPPELIVNTGP